MGYSPRQLQAFLFLARKRRQHELSEELYVNTLAARGDEKAVRGQLKAWADGE
jgi:hypothetical protein